MPSALFFVQLKAFRPRPGNKDIEGLAQFFECISKFRQRVQLIKRTKIDEYIRWVFA